MSKGTVGIPYKVAVSNARGRINYTGGYYPARKLQSYTNLSHNERGTCPTKISLTLIVGHSRFLWGIGQLIPTQQE